MMDIGRVCVKIAGRDAGLKCVIVKVIDDNYVFVDGETRARKVNINHLEPLDIKIEVPKAATREQILTALKDAGIKLKEPKKKIIKENKKAK